LNGSLWLRTEEPLVELVEVTQACAELALTDDDPDEADDESDEQEVFHGGCEECFIKQ
jgi:hypothetical protein